MFDEVFILISKFHCSNIVLLASSLQTDGQTVMCLCGCMPRRRPDQMSTLCVQLQIVFRRSLLLNRWSLLVTALHDQNL